VAGAGAVRGQNVSLPDDELAVIGEKIFNNECGGKSACLVSWNEGEDFASLGIGHFIWYPWGRDRVFHESFPELVEFFKTQGVALPGWLNASPMPLCPWSNRQDFLMNGDNPWGRDLHNLLAATRSQQTLFIIRRLDQALPKMLDTVDAEKRRDIREKFERVSRVPGGWYALADYVNFKGEGTKIEERYEGRGWGLLQVLEEMDGSVPDGDLLKEFSSAADRVLSRRVRNAPAKRDEDRWLPGWRNRVATYAP